MKKEYLKPEIEIVEFQVFDAIMDVGDKDFSDGAIWEDE